MGWDNGLRQRYVVNCHSCGTLNEIEIAESKAAAEKELQSGNFAWAPHAIDGYWLCSNCKPHPVACPCCGAPTHD